MGRGRGLRPTPCCPARQDPETAPGQHGVLISVPDGTPVLRNHALSARRPRAELEVVRRGVQSVLLAARVSAHLSVSAATSVVDPLNRRALRPLKYVFLKPDRSRWKSSDGWPQARWLRHSPQRPRHQPTSSGSCTRSTRVRGGIRLPDSLRTARTSRTLSWIELRETFLMASPSNDASLLIRSGDCQSPLTS